MADEKRDAVVEKAYKAFDGASFEYCNGSNILHRPGRTEVVGLMASFASIEVAAERTRIADKLEWVKAGPTTYVELCKALETFIEQLRGSDNDGTNR